MKHQALFSSKAGDLRVNANINKLLLLLPVVDFLLPLRLEKLLSGKFKGGV